MRIKEELRRLLEKEGYEVISSSSYGNGDLGIRFRLKITVSTGGKNGNE